MNDASENKPTATAAGNRSARAVDRISRRRLWLFRLGALVLAPVVVLGMVELVLRLVGYGYETGFLLPGTRGSEKSFVQNNQFGWRFFGPQLSRKPFPLSIAQAKPPGTVRIIVFGESAAKGDPEPYFGLPRMLQAILELRYPGVRFEVVNAAMTAINSHAVLEIARDCAKANGDIWVVYMGNNEVVGPFGAGTVFGHQAAPLPLIRASLALKATRTGQLLESLWQRFRKPSATAAEWQGMKMFLDQQVRADDKRMNRVYDHFERNLSDILRTGRRNGVGIVLSTVPVNLKDCAPFASSHRPGLSQADRLTWDKLYELGTDAEAAGNYQEAAGSYQAAGRLDDTFADLRFRQGRCAVVLGQTNEAQTHFSAARDLDTLRFRCDSTLNNLTRRLVLDGKEQGVKLVDAERVFAEQSRDGLPGEELFYEHVHLTWAGNYLLARALAEKIEQLLPREITSRIPTNQTWPSIQDCARRLAWTDWSLFSSLRDILNRESEPPFTGQLNHGDDIGILRTRMKELRPAIEPAGIILALAACNDATAGAPNDPLLYVLTATLKQAAGDLSGAAAAARHALELLPDDADTWQRLGLILAQQRDFNEASAAYQHACQLDPVDVLSVQNLAQCLWILHKPDDAIRLYRQVLALRPDLSVAWIGLGQILEEEGRSTDADDCYRRALATHPDRASDLVTLARFCRGRNWLGAAVTNYNRAIELDPLNPNLRVESGEFLTSLNRHADAAEQFHEALLINPGLVNVRLNYGITLMNQQRYPEALDQFDEVTKQNPTNALALKYAQALREMLARKQPH